MRLIIDIDLQNAAFDDDNGDICRILRELSERLESAYTLSQAGAGELLPVRDVNGNNVGKVGLRPSHN